MSYNDDRIRYVKNEKNLKLIATLNKGILLAKGEYIARMDADDISTSNRIMLQYNFLQENPEIGIVGTCFQSFNESETFSVTQYPKAHFEIKYNQLFLISLK